MIAHDLGMRAVASGRLLRMLRLRRGWRQADVAGRAGLSSSVIGRHEQGAVRSLAAIERHAAVFELRVDVRLVGRGAALARLADEEHAAIVELLAAFFRTAGWLVEAEASFSEWGERGRIDLLAYEPRTGTLLIVEVKTEFADLQDLFGTMNVKERLAASIADRKDWKVGRTVTMLAAAGTEANRRVAREHPAMFGSFEPRRLTLSVLTAGPSRILHWVDARAARRTGWLAGRQRVRRSRDQ